MKHTFSSYNHFINPLPPKTIIPNLKSTQSFPCYFRNSMISKINSILSTPLFPLTNTLQIFYLSIHYLDIILLQKHFNISNPSTQTYLSVTSLILSLKFIGIYDNKLTKIIRNILQKHKITNYTSFENKILSYLNYKLTYITPYDYICFFLSNSMYYDVKMLALNILKWFVETNKFNSYSSVVIAFAIVRLAQKVMKVALYVPSIKEVYGKEEQIEMLFKYLIDEYDVDGDDCFNMKRSGCVSYREQQVKGLKMNGCVTERKQISCNENKDRNGKDVYVYKKKIVSRNNSPNQIKYNATTAVNMNNLNKRRVDSGRKINLSKITKISIDNIGKLCTRYLKTEV